MIRIAVIGVGKMGAAHAENVARLRGAKLHSVVDPDLATAQRVAATYGVVATTDYREVLTNPDVDAIIIASQSDTHAEIIKAAAEADKAMLCEKPIALSMEEVEECLTVLDRARVPFMLGFNRRFDPSFQRVYESVRSGGVGEVEMVCITSRDALPPPAHYVKASGGIFRDMTIHDFDMARWLLGEEPTEVFAMGTCLVDPAIEEAGDVDTAMVILKTASGKLCQINNSRRSVVGYDQRVEVFGSEGCLKSLEPRFDSELPAMTTGNHFAHIHRRYAASYRAELEHFCQCLHEGLVPNVRAEDGWVALRIANAAQKSLEEGRPQSIGLVASPV